MWSVNSCRRFSMWVDGSKNNVAGVGDHSGNVADLERQGDALGFNRPGSGDQMLMTPPQPPSPPPPPLPLTVPQSMPPLTFVVSNGEPLAPPEGTRKASEAVGSFVEELATTSAKKGHLSRSGSSHEQCRYSYFPCRSSCGQHAASCYHKMIDFEINSQ